MIYADKNSEKVNVSAQIEQLKSKGFKSKEIATILSTLFNLNKNEVYKLTMNK